MLVEQGRLGQKTGAGFYIYNPETRQKQVDDQVMVWVAQAALAEGIQRQCMTDSQIVQRLTQAIIDEGFQVLNDGIAQSASDIDLALVFGYGYPAHLGGPMYMASLEYL
jgi:3-hydroxyacyl-CoA dehydrogenase